VVFWMKRCGLTSLCRHGIKYKVWNDLC
jgi:hypothetical protein